MAITPTIGTPHPRAVGMSLADTLDDILDLLDDAAIDSLVELAPASTWDPGVRIRLYAEAMKRDAARR
jgi:hypothetical protein